MKILFLGDIVGRSGRRLIQAKLPALIKKKKPDFVIANGENLAGGTGINRSTMQEMLDAGIDVLTGGNHTFENKEGVPLFSESALPVLRPANLPEGVPGHGYRVLTAKNGEKLLLINLLGRIFMPQHVDCPFRTLDRILAEVPSNDYNAVFIDFHAEATSEKQALRWAYDGRISAVIGSHTHVQTADADISPLGTAFMADAGMNGSLDSCLGVRKDQVIKKLRTQLPVHYDVEMKGRMQINGVFMEMDKKGKAKKIETIREVFSSLPLHAMKLIPTT